ncbi:cell division protein ZapE [Motilimonas eburnea]|uniref:cell division protein ZapE n=1 Tax=Motilimonas eburnea TaxID=1737488 RepID=UPI001E5235B7|nr:AFG1 family ATPase [Motilimonas eburnea]
MTPLLKYQNDLKREDFFYDAAQEQAVFALDRLYHDLLKPQPRPAQTSWINRIKLTFQKPEPIEPIRGLYFWGGVGRGKTYLVDTFFDCLPFNEKMRVHFHRFMHRVHQELGLLKQQSDPLLIIADKLAKEARVICFDEFFVSDITDAMLLGTLFEALFERGVVLVATSNIIPDELYRNGLQRERFLPAIKLINQHCQIVNVDSGIDYRMRTLEQAEIYHAPLDDKANENLQRYFLQLSSEPRQYDLSIDILNRQIPVLAEADSVLFIDFSALCESARSQNDYIEIAKIYHTVLLANVCVMGGDKDDAARRFIAMVDEFYERHVALIISAEVEMEQLYRGGRLSFEFQRCLSRLQEMQSKEYLAREHLA